MGPSKKRRDDGTDDGTLSHPRICKPLYGPLQGNETGDWTDDGIGLLHVIRLRYSIFIGGQTSTLSLKRDERRAMKRVSSSVPSLKQRHGPVSHRVSVARRQRRDSGPWHIDLQVSRRLSRRPVVPSLFRPTGRKLLVVDLQRFLLAIDRWSTHNWIRNY